MNFDVFGPFEIPRTPSLTIIEHEKQAVEKVSKDANNENGEPKGRPGLSNAPGGVLRFRDESRKRIHALVRWEIG